MDEVIDVSIGGTIKVTIAVSNDVAIGDAVEDTGLSNKVGIGSLK